MGCFYGCFSSSKVKKCRKLKYKAIPRDQKPRIQDILRADLSVDLSINEKPSNPFSELREKTEVQPLKLKKRKKVTFDTNVTTYEHINVYDSTESLLEKNEKGETFPKSRDDSAVLRTSNYRYGNCQESDDEFEDFDHDDYDFDEDDYELDDDEEHYDDANDDEHELMDPLNSKARDENGYISPVLNPIENLTQWKALKSNGTTRKPLSFNGQKVNSCEPKNQNLNSAVDASLSSWLVSLEKSARNNKRVAAYNNSELEITTTSEFKGRLLG
ncbi:uncharacterized protein [Rutidosis leptorrhynchoides]|uniref:uncharacterized protein n=1 Tax=Rutidosis leptorrhynchoides TaxID=125765 RepID=UPI003A99168B